MAWPSITENVTKATKAFFEALFTNVELIAGEAAKKTEATPATAAATGNVASLKGIPEASLFDGVTLTEGQVVLLPLQSGGAQSQNGLWEIKKGTTAWVRPTGFESGSEQYGVF